MKKILIVLPITIALLSFKSAVNKRPNAISNDSFLRGEILDYRLHYKFINAGVGRLKILPGVYNVNGKPCYRIEATGRSVGSLALFLKIKDLFRSYVDTSSMAPQQFYRSISEGNYKLKEKTLFDYSSHKVKVVRQRKGKEKQNKDFQVPKDIHDFMSGLCYLRNVDFGKMKEGENIPMNVFFEDEIFNVSFKYAGRENLKIKRKKYRAIKLIPEMPKNQFFDDKYKVQVWLSDDKNHLPLRLECGVAGGGASVGFGKIFGSEIHC